MRFQSLAYTTLFLLGGCAVSSGGGDDTTDSSATGADATTSESGETTAETTAETTTDTSGDGDGDACIEINVDDASWELSDTLPNVVIATLTTDLGLDTPDTIQVEFFHGGDTPVQPPLGMDLDLGAGGNANYATCTDCVRVFEDINTTSFGKQYFQSSGTLRVDAFDTDTFNQFAGTLTNVRLVEVTGAEAPDFTTTPVPGGSCLILSSSTIDTQVGDGDGDGDG